MLGYLYWIHRGAAGVERQYSYQPPLNLLALRVFGSPNLADFLNLSDAWQWIGTRQLLDGPDTAGHKAKDLLNYLAGRIDRSITGDATELSEALEAFSTWPDRMLRFPVNSMQCANATWKEALQHLLDRADVVVMDLSSLSAQNRGVAYELGKLVDEVPLNRVVLLFDESTDLNVLKDILARAHEGIAADSPNRQGGGLRVRVFDMGGTTARKPDESAYDWKRRIRTRMNEHALVGLLFDAAQPPRSATTIDPKRDWAAIRWPSRNAGVASLDLQRRVVGPSIFRRYGQPLPASVFRLIRHQSVKRRRHHCRLDHLGTVVARLERHHNRAVRW